MRIVVAGSRQIRFHTNLCLLAEAGVRALSGCVTPHIITGCCPTGADNWARNHGPERASVFQADWDRHGKAAGPIRNAQMAVYAAEEPGGALLLIWDGKSRGSRSMLKEARIAGLRVLQIVTE